MEHLLRKYSAQARTREASYVTSNMTRHIVENDLIGVGAGPANLSLSALLSTARERGLTSVRAAFLESGRESSGCPRTRPLSRLPPTKVMHTLLVGCWP